MSATTTSPPESATTDEPEEGRRSRLRFVIVSAVVVIGASIAAYLFLFGGDAAADVDSPPAEGAVVEVGTLTTNLAGAPTRYARVGIALVLTEDTDALAVEERFPLVKDAAINELGQHEAATLQAPGGYEALRDGLAERVMQLYPDGEVLRVALTELLIQ